MTTRSYRDLDDLQSALKGWRSANFPTARDKGLQTLGVGEEAGELVSALFHLFEAIGRSNHSVLKHEQGIRGTSEEHRAALKDALGDIVVFTMSVADCFDMQMSDILLATAATVFNRDWVNNPVDGVES